MKKLEGRKQVNCIALLFACTYMVSYIIGSAISTYGIAILAETAGWNSTILIWGLIELAGTAICFVFVHPWKRKYMHDTLV